MQIIQNVVIFLIAIAHVGFLYLEMFMWQTPKGQKIFKIDADFAQKSRALAANQGLYNGFLAAGLFWSLLSADPFNFQLKVFFLICVLIAGVFGALTASKNIIFYQAIPAFIGLVLVFLGR